jgi:hypothetical protein
MHEQDKVHRLLCSASLLEACPLTEQKEANHEPASGTHQCVFGAQG